MFNKAYTLFVVLLAAPLTLPAMSVKLVSGSLKPLKGEQRLKVEYVYAENLQVGKMSEADYIQKKMKEHDEKVPGSGKQWLEKWKGDRARYCHPKFEELMNEIFGKKKQPLRVSSSLSEPTKYTLIVTTTFIEPGWNVGIAAKPSYIDATIDIVESANPGTSIARIEVKKSPGRKGWGTDYDVAQRLMESYAKCGKEVANLIYKKGLK